MDVVVFAVVLIGLAAYVAAPLYRPAPPGPDDRPDDAGREAAAVALGDLELDRASGLVDEASYERERADLDSKLPD
jgi:hypothetical protein